MMIKKKQKPVGDLLRTKVVVEDECLICAGDIEEDAGCWLCGGSRVMYVRPHEDGTKEGGTVLRI